MKKLDISIENVLNDIQEYQNPEQLNFCVKSIKSVAKSYFFKGKLNSFVFFLTQPFDVNHEVFFSLEMVLKEYIKSTSAFIQKTHFTLEEERKVQNLTNDLNGILTQLDYQHLLPMIHLFSK